MDAVIARMGPDHIMVESDYPHADSTWPHTADMVKSNFGHLPADVVEKVARTNAASLFGVALPDGSHPSEAR